MTDFFDRLPDHRPIDVAQAAKLLIDIRNLVDPELQDHMATADGFFGWLVEGSPFLRRLLKVYPDVMADIKGLSLDDYIARQLSAAESEMALFDDRDAAMSCLRHCRNRCALAIALGDLADYWDVEKVTDALTRLADMAVRASLDFLLREAVAAGRLEHFSRDGIVVLALGKHGGQELNYSSDIDFIVYYTSGSLTINDKLDEGKFYITLVRDLTAMLQTPTAEGYVFRVDLRLRPDPGSTPVAISVAAALSYYESMGQNWERAVYIKARPIAGDLAAGKKFISDLQPYIWRRYFDFAAIEDVHSMKRQIHAVRGHSEIAAAGHNLKLGRGGIREIEFFVQTQQLIAGGRDEDLRGHRTVDMLAMLAAKQWISQDTAARLTQAYYYLRRMEHRLQMKLDEQTQTLPRAGETFDAFARFAGYQTGEDFSAALKAVLGEVTQEYALLFEQAESLSGSAGNLVFTGNEDDPDTIETLSKMGFARPKDVSSLVRGWHAGRMGATRSARAREILTRLQPIILEKLAMGSDADGGFMRFHNFLENLPAGVQVFSLFQSNPHVLSLLIDIVTVAPRLAAFLSRNTGLLDTLVQDSGTPSPPPHINITLFESAMDSLRRYVHEEQFRIGTRSLADPIMATHYGEAYTPLAETAIDIMLQAARADIERQYGAMPGAEVIVLGLGKLGSGEMTLQSDLDLIFICDAPDFSAPSDGDKPIDAERWLARLARRFISGLSAPTAEGGLFEVDTRLRPSGNAGALVTKLAAFERYQLHDAWTWEHMALTRARVLAGDTELAQKVVKIVSNVLTQKRDRSALVKDVSDMRVRLRAHQPQRGPFDIRRGDGGLVDVEFIVQSLQLAHNRKYQQLVGARDILSLLHDLRDCRLLDEKSYRQLKEAVQAYSALRQIASLCLEDDEREPAQATQSVLLEALNEADIGRLHDSLAKHRSNISMIFDTVMTQLVDSELEP